MKNMYRLTAITITLLLYCAHKSYWVQREDYKNHIAMRLQSACAALIQNDFGRHASLFDISEKNNYSFGVKSQFTLYNDLLSLEILGRSTVFFTDYAPQEITCRASLPYGRAGYGNDAKITKDTLIDFYILGIKYLPENYKYSFVKKYLIQLTMKEMEKLSPLITIVPLEKPHYSIYNFYSR